MTFGSDDQLTSSLALRDELLVLQVTTGHWVSTNRPTDGTKKTCGNAVTFQITNGPVRVLWMLIMFRRDVNREDDGREYASVHKGYKFI